MTAAGPDLSALSAPAAAAWLFAVDPAGLGGVVVRSRADAIRERWMAALRGLVPADRPFRRLPLHAHDSRVFGGLDLTATLASGRPIAERGVLADSDGGVLVLCMAERVSEPAAARLGAVLDTGFVSQQHGSAGPAPARFGVVALDEGIDAEERSPAGLRDRLAFWIELQDFDPTTADRDGSPAVADARAVYPSVMADDDILRALCETAAALGVDSLRASILVLRAARAAAALAGRVTVDEQDAALAVRLVLAPRATRLPVEEAAEPQADSTLAPDQPTREERSSAPDETATEQRADEPLGDVVLTAAKAAIPAGLLERLQADAARGRGPQRQSRSGALRVAATRGRPAGVRRGKPQGGARLNIVETLRAAAPWQRLRRHAEVEPTGRVAVRADDFRLTRFKQRTETTTIFVVDASGSLAVNRLAEVKGAIELLLADCYVRRDQVALLAFRGSGAALLLPPTRSLARAKRCLAELPGGGGTPLASAIDAAVGVADTLKRRGQAPVVVFVTDGRANVARDGGTGRGRADQDAHAAARAAAATGVRMLLVDAAQRPHATAEALAKSLGALYIPLPRADAGVLSRAVRAATDKLAV